MSRFLDPKVLMAIKDLSLAAKTTVDGFLTGMNKSRLKGPGIEFSQYRSYQPGDDLRSMDWKMFARSDRYYIRESEIETNISVRLMIDASASMNHKDGEFSKFDYARYLVASLAYLANLQSDAIGLYVFQDQSMFSLAPKQSYQHLSRLFHQLEVTQAAGRFTRPIHYRDIFAGAGRRELLIFVTDLYQQDAEIFKLLDSLSALRHEIVVFQIMARNEMEMDYDGYTNLEDLETGAIVKADSSDLSAYQQRVHDYLARVRTELLNRQITHQVLTIDQPLDQALRDFLNQRNKLAI